MPYRNTQALLKATSAVVVGVGAVVALAAHPATAGVTTFFVDLVFWPVDGQPSVAAPEARLLSAVSGGVMVGWGVMLWLVATRLLPADPPLAAALVRAGAVTWFAVDSLGSIAAGAPLNALLNVVFLLALVVPLVGIATRPATT